MLEAMASGLPVLATRHGGIPEAVDEGTTGYLMDEGDYRGLAEGMERLGANVDQLPLFSAAARAAVTAKFDAAVQANCLEQIYAELITMS
jgi:glycosyltransferase involved in cell wall biosynthesis